MRTTDGVNRARVAPGSLAILSWVQNTYGEFRLSKWDGTFFNQAEVDCEACGDTRKNLAIFLGEKRRGVFYCWRCMRKGRLQQFAHDATSLETAVAMAFDAPEQEQHEKVSIPPLTRTLPPQTIHYLESRGVDSRLFYASHAHRNRAIFLIRDRAGGLISYVARAIFPWMQPRYIYPKHHPPHALTGIERVDTTRPIYIVEGLFDHLFVPNSIALNGSRLTDQQKYSIIQLNPIQIVFALDADARDKQFLCMKSMYNTGVDVCGVFVPKDDPCSIGTDKLLSLPILSFEEWCVVSS